MNKEFIPYEQALELKELGFLQDDTTCRCVQNEHSDDEEHGWGILWQQAFRWFREKYDIHYSIDRHCSQHDHKWGYNWSLYNYTGIFDEYLTSHPVAPVGEWVYETYEEAELACLKKLIEIIKNK